MDEHRRRRVGLAHLHRRVGVALASFGDGPGRRLLETEQQWVVRGQRLERAAAGVAQRVGAQMGGDVARHHVCLALVHACVGDVRAQGEDVGGLHRRVDQLGEVDALTLLAAQDADAALHASQRGVLADLDDRGPVVVALVV